MQGRKKLKNLILKYYDYDYDYTYTYSYVYVQVLFDVHVRTTYVPYSYSYHLLVDCTYDSLGLYRTVRTKNQISCMEIMLVARK